MTKRKRRPHALVAQRIAQTTAVVAGQREAVGWKIEKAIAVAARAAYQRGRRDERREWAAARETPDGTGACACARSLEGMVTLPNGDVVTKMAPCSWHGKGWIPA